MFERIVRFAKRTRKPDIAIAPWGEQGDTHAIVISPCRHCRRLARLCSRKEMNGACALISPRPGEVFERQRFLHKVGRRFPSLLAPNCFAPGGQGWRDACIVGQAAIGVSQNATRQKRGERCRNVIGQSGFSVPQ